MPPAISTSSETHPISEISGSSHSSKNTFWPLRQPLGAASCFGQTGFERSDELPSPFARIDHRTQSPNHIEDPGDAPLIEGMDLESTANEIRRNVGLEIGERQDKIGL